MQNKKNVDLPEFIKKQAEKDKEKAINSDLAWKLLTNLNYPYMEN